MTRRAGPFIAIAALALLAGGCDAPAGMTTAAKGGSQPAIALTGRVVDRANILKADTEARLTTLSADLEQVKQHQLVVVTVASLDGRAIETYTRDLANAWAIGRRRQDDGVVLLVAPNEKRVRIEVGYGLEKRLTNAKAATIISRDLLPRFRAGDMEGGVEQGSRAIVRELIRT